MIHNPRIVVLILVVAAHTIPAGSQEAPPEADFPVAGELLVDGDLFVSANQALWQVDPQGEVREIAGLDTNLGLAAIGERDLLAADFGPTNAFNHDRNSDGIIWRISPEGNKEEWATGIGDPNFVVVRQDGSVLASDDATSDIYLIGADRKPMLFTTAVNHPNGLVLSADESVLYVAQMFKSIKPVVRDDSLWAIELSDGKPVGAGKLVARAGSMSLPMEKLERFGDSTPQPKSSH